MWQKQKCEITLKAILWIAEKKCMNESVFRFYLRWYVNKNGKTSTYTAACEFPWCILNVSANKKDCDGVQFIAYWRSKRYSHIVYMHKNAIISIPLLSFPPLPLVLRILYLSLTHSLSHTDWALFDNLILLMRQLNYSIYCISCVQVSAFWVIE